MERRGFLARILPLAAGAALLPQTRVSALLRCTPFSDDGYQQCEVGIDSSVAEVVASAVGGQHLSQWCWAACIETVFRYYGFVVRQERIVRETWGDIVNLPAYAEQILANLNRRWVDDNGRSFSCFGDVSSANPATAAQDLADNRPLIIGTPIHAMVLTALTYWRNGMGGGEVTEAIVRDPMPGCGRRVLTAYEWYSVNFLARIRVRAG